ncbi:MAG TPA: GerMN domain-containing protein [Ilumatobacteraceae bacterium]|jgi:spore germination protein GerM|nr:GerMN domain-containing protein [Ilumatobacteraceae bacterium]
MLRRLLLISGMLAGLLVACGIPDSGKVSRIQDKDLRQLGDTIPTTAASTVPPTTLEPTTTAAPIDPSTTIAIEEVTLYFISGGQLKGYPRALAKPATTNQVLTALQEGPPGGQPGVGIRSAIPTRAAASLNVKPDDGSGIATIELPAGFFSQIAPEDQLLAIGQIVLTVTEVGGIGQVLFSQDGQPVGVPRRGGGFSNGNEPLARRDYEELLNTTVTTTTTTTAAPVETIPAG